ncbi:MAG: hypothetical protein NTW50_02610 [Candidatus Berkelbacteria bacterium]|nr:hypothetical protein [Candidatus Berkelbacteria bacterium]
MNENSKNFASYEVFPELNHNAIQGLVFPANTINFILMLESNFEQERVTLRQNISAEIIRKHKIPLERLKFIGFQDRIFETLWYVFWGDYVSYYLAILHKADPSANDDITALKNRLI